MQAKVDGNTHILKIELDLEEIPDLRVSDLDVQFSGIPDLEALVRIYDPSYGPTRVDTLESSLALLPPRNDFKRVFTVYALKMLL